MEGELEEASTNFDAENLKPFLLRVAGFVEEGFGVSEIDKVMAMAALPPESEEEVEFSVIYGGQRTPLRVRVFMDDVEAPDVYFFTSTQLRQRIGQEIHAFFAELGM
jgi:hypothetical protein